jgi:mono/diheme cytochrome c family protein
MKNILPLIFLLILLLSFALAACGGATSTPAPSGGNSGMAYPAPPAEYAGKKNPMGGDAAAAEAGKQTFNIYCASCHGQSGQGDGPAAASLDPKPQDLAGHEVEMGDDYLYWRIAEGGMMEPFKSAMPAWKDALSEEQIWQIISYLRTLGQ